MSKDSDPILGILGMYAEEHYAHARDHEHLRAEITSILTAAALVLIGFAISKDPPTSVLQKLAALVAIVVSIQNAWLVILHNNRFDMHVSIARQARLRMTKIALEGDWHDGDRNRPLDDPCKIKGDPRKFGNLGWSWLSVPMVPLLAGIFILFR